MTAPALPPLITPKPRTNTNQRKDRPMPATNQSAYQDDLWRRREAARQAAASRALLREHRHQVNMAMRLHRDATQFESQLAAYDQDRDGFQQRVHTDRAQWWLRAI